MKYYILILIIFLFIGCSGNPTIPPRSVDASPWLSHQNVLSDSINEYFKFGCAPYGVSDLWDRIYDIIGDKQYEAVYGGGVGEMTIITNPFGIKYIDGLPYEYQYGFLVVVKKDTSGNISTQTITMIVEPLGSFARRVRDVGSCLTGRFDGVAIIKGNLQTRRGRIFNAGVVDTHSWLGISNRYLSEHPTTYFQFERPETNCEINTTESHGMVDVEGVGVNDLTMWAAWFFPTSYDVVTDEIGGYLRVQYTHNPTDTNFVQIWEMTLAQVD